MYKCATILCGVLSVHRLSCIFLNVQYLYMYSTLLPFTHAKYKLEYDCREYYSNICILTLLV